MIMSTDECLDRWRKAIIKSVGFDDAPIVLDNMRKVIDRAKQAEAEGRMIDMQPAFAMVNSDREKVLAGWYFIEIVYYEPGRPKTGGLTRHTIPVLRPDERSAREEGARSAAQAPAA